VSSIDFAEIRAEIPNNQSYVYIWSAKTLKEVTF